MDFEVDENQIPAFGSLCCHNVSESKPPLKSLYLDFGGGRKGYYPSINPSVLLQFYRSAGYGSPLPLPWSPGARALCGPKGPVHQTFPLTRVWPARQPGHPALRPCAAQCQVRGSLQPYPQPARLPRCGVPSRVAAGIHRPIHPLLRAAKKSYN
jgi:hypothetical protein